MVRISSFPDLSRFVKRQDKMPLHNTVLYLIAGEDSIEVSGIFVILNVLKIFQF